MKKKNALVFLNGQYEDYDVLQQRIIRQINSDAVSLAVAVDGGLNHMDAMQMVPTHILGDFDSMKNIEALRKKYQAANWLEFPPEKDMTDSELVFDFLVHQACNQIIIIGSFGGRIDHMLGSLFLLKRYQSYFESIVLIDEQNSIELLKGPVQKRVIKNSEDFRYISLIPISENASGIYLEGFKYPLKDATIEFGQTLGISNELVAHQGVINLEFGEVLLIYSKDK